VTNNGSPAKTAGRVASSENKMPRFLARRELSPCSSRSLLGFAIEGMVKGLHLRG
jgi:hypothetical protein